MAASSSMPTGSRSLTRWPSSICSPPSAGCPRNSARPARTTSFAARQWSAMYRMAWMRDVLQDLRFTPAHTIDVLRLAYLPERIVGPAGHVLAARRNDLAANGYSVKPLGSGDCVVSIRHEDIAKIIVSGKKPEQSVMGSIGWHTPGIGSARMSRPSGLAIAHYS